MPTNDAICRVWGALDSGLDWDRIEEVVNPLLDGLVDAGYVEQWGQSSTGCFWAITESGHERLRTLGQQTEPN